MSELSTQFDGGGASGLVSVTATQVAVIGPLDIQPYVLLSVYAENVGGGGGNDLLVTLHAAPTADGPWVDLGTSDPVASGDAVFLSDETLASYKYIQMLVSCAAGQSTTAKLWLCAGGYGRTSTYDPPVGELDSQFDGDATSGEVSLTSANQVVVGPVDVQDYDRFTVYIENLRGEGGDDVEDALLETAPTADGPWISAGAPNGAEGDFALNATLASWHTKAFKYVRVRASVDAGESTTAKFWLSAGK
ncbi:hypothetical protein [Microbacterium sp.]|uniref:hypothetical protein n=1 Tax=Microbacterium sp. TaxID=51671 RepID=UPI002734E858|nr:hypothetical protein [Microbacterium sp.]MDP3951602.1 hypothetical protein [Microbacterium sp.]